MRGNSFSSHAKYRQISKFYIAYLRALQKKSMHRKKEAIFFFTGKI